MKKQITLSLILLSSFLTFSQVKFEKGYFISNNGIKTECLIKNIEWNYNPSEFTYKIEGSEKSKIASISNAKEFGIYNIFKYSRFTVKIDRSKQNLQTLSYNRAPEWSEESLFLKQLVDGGAKLYQYKKSALNKFFYSIDNSNIEQLIYKVYKTNNENVAKNLTYINQLHKKVNCNNYTIEKIKKTNYNQSDLIKYFEHYNYCKNPKKQKETSFKINKGDFNLKLTPGVNFSSLSISNDEISQNKYNIDYGSNVTFRVGIEAEYVLPYNKNKWSLFIEPAYTYYKSKIEKEIPNGFINSTSTLDTEAEIIRIEMPVGVRYYLFLNNDSKIFINTAFVLALDLDSKIKFNLRPDLDDIGSKVYFLGGLGYNLKNKFSIEMRYYSKDILSNYLFWKSDNKTFSIILGYNLF